MPELQNRHNTALLLYSLYFSNHLIYMRIMCYNMWNDRSDGSNLMAVSASATEATGVLRLADKNIKFMFLFIHQPQHDHDKHKSTSKSQWFDNPLYRPVVFISILFNRCSWRSLRQAELCLNHLRSETKIWAPGPAREIKPSWICKCRDKQSKARGYWSWWLICIYTPAWISSLMLSGRSWRAGGASTGSRTKPKGSDLDRKEFCHTWTCLIACVNKP